MTVRSLGLMLMLILALAALGCSDAESAETLDEPVAVAAPKKNKRSAPTPTVDTPIASDNDTSAPATDAPATKTTETEKPVDKAATPPTDANKPVTPAPAGKDLNGTVATLQACVASCGDDKECAKTCIEDAAAGAKVPAGG